MQTHELNIFLAHGVKEIYLGQRPRELLPSTYIHSLLGAGTGSKQVKSIKVGQEGGTNQVKMIKIDTANGCSPPVSNQKHHTQ